MIHALEKEIILLNNKARYIKENLDGTIDLRKKKRDQVRELLHSKGYDVMDQDADYNYLTKMPMDSVTEENVEKLFKELGEKQTLIETIKVTTINQMWSTELDALIAEYLEYREERERTMLGNDVKPKKKVVVKSANAKNTKITKIVIEE
jgi:DNA topoisomerase-2